MANATVTLTGDERQFLQSVIRASAEEKKFEDQIRRTGEAGERAGEQVGGSMEKAGRRGLSEFDKLLRELRKTGPEGRKQAQAIEQQLQEAGLQGRQSIGTIVDKLGEIEPAAKEAAEAMQREMEENSQVVEAKLVRMASPLDHFKTKAKDTFGVGSLGEVKGYTAALGAITATLTLATKGFEKFKEKQDEAIGSLESQAIPEKRLAQIATSSQDLEDMLKQADQISLQTGLSREETRNLIFSARSEGFGEDVGQIARFGQVVDTGAQGSLAGSLGRLFSGEGLNVEQRLSGVLAAAEQSAFDFETVGASVKKSAAPAAASGADLAETLAANATLANLIGESAGDRLKAFASKVGINEDLQGQGIIGSVESIQAMSEEDRKDFLGESIELNEAFKLLADNLPEVKKITDAVRKDIEASTKGQGVLGQRTAIVEGSDRFNQRRDILRAEIAKEIAAESRYSESGAEIKVAQDMLDARLDELGVGTTSQYLATDARVSDIPIIGGIASSILPNVSFSEALQYGGQSVGIDPSFSSDAVAATTARLTKSNIPWYARPFVSNDAAGQIAALQMRGMNRRDSPESLALQPMPQTVAPQSDSSTSSKEAIEELKKIREAQERAARNVFPPNYSSGLSVGAAGAAQP